MWQKKCDLEEKYRVTPLNVAKKVRFRGKIQDYSSKCGKKSEI